MFQKQALAAALLMLLAAASSAVAAVEQVSVRIDGLACPFCAYNIEKRVKTLDGVKRDARIVTSVENGTAKFPWKPGVAFDPSRIDVGLVLASIREAGFRPTRANASE